MPEDDTQTGEGGRKVGKRATPTRGRSAAAKPTGRKPRSPAPPPTGVEVRAEPEVVIPAAGVAPDPEDALLTAAAARQAGEEALDAVRAGRDELLRSLAASNGGSPTSGSRSGRRRS